MAGCLMWIFGDGSRAKELELLNAAAIENEEGFRRIQSPVFRQRENRYFLHLSRGNEVILD